MKTKQVKKSTPEITRIQKCVCKNVSNLDIRDLVLTNDQKFIEINNSLRKIGMGIFSFSNIEFRIEEITAVDSFGGGTRHILLNDGSYLSVFELLTKKDLEALSEYLSDNSNAEIKNFFSIKGKGKLQLYIALTSFNKFSIAYKTLKLEDSSGIYRKAKHTVDYIHLITEVGRQRFHTLVF